MNKLQTQDAQRIPKIKSPHIENLSENRKKKKKHKGKEKILKSSQTPSSKNDYFENNSIYTNN